MSTDRLLGDGKKIEAKNRGYRYPCYEYRAGKTI